MLRRNEFPRHFQIVGIIQNQQPARIVCQPMLYGGDSLALILCVFFGKVEQSGHRHEIRDQRFARLSLSPQHDAVRVLIAVSILDGGLRFAHAAQSVQRLHRFASTEALVNIGQDVFAPGEESVLRKWKIENPAAGNARFAPDTAIFQPQKQRRNPAVNSISNRAASNGQRAINLAVFQQFGEENRHRTLDGFLADFALHRQNGGNSGFSQSRSQSNLRGVASVAVFFARAFAGSQNNQTRYFHQFLDPISEVAGWQFGSRAIFVLQQQLGNHLSGNLSVANQIENVHALANGCDQAIERQRFFVANDLWFQFSQRFARAIKFNLNLRQSVFIQIARRSDGNQGFQFCFWAKFDDAPISAEDEPRKDDSLRSRQRAADFRVAHQLPTDSVEFSQA